ncbi:MAG: hypothetical protein NC181_04895 [Clostridium sp.]|nr:hypothetical protein [Clostridium sp.]MCM1444566.1 hypothetical protein [Candidatus Amulumruptor caecigallinarius]
MNDIDIYENSSIILNRKTPLKIISWLFILISFSTFLIIFGGFYKFKKYQSYISIFTSNHLILLVEEKNISNIGNRFILDNKIYNFSIESISKDYVIENNKNYREVLLNVDLEENYKIENNILNINLEGNDTTLLKEIIKFFKKGMM